MANRRQEGDGSDDEPVGLDEVRRRATGGAAVLATRGILILGLGLVANVILARLLNPRDYGLIALGGVVLVLGGYLAESGLSASLIRRAEAPTRRELEALNALQLAGTVALVLICAAVALPFGRDGAVIAAMAGSLPIMVLRAPSVIVLERQLNYRLMALIDVVDAIVFYTWSITAVALGMGVWGMATGMAARALAGTTLMLLLGPLGPVRPRWSWPLVRPLVGFGAKLQAVAAVGIARDQGINIAAAAVGGLATVGVWNLAYRVLQIPTMMFSAVNRISYPTMSRLRVAGRDPRPAIERSVGSVTVLTGVLVVGTASFAPALPVLAGDEWADVPSTLALSCLAILVNAPIYLASVGYLYALDEPGSVLRSMAVYAAVWLGVTVPLLPEFGAPAIGAGWIVAAVVNAVLLARSAHRSSGAAFATTFLPPALVAAAAGGAGWAIATAGDETVLDGVIAALAAEAILLGGLMLVRRPLLHATYKLVAEAVSSGSAGTPWKSPSTTDSSSSTSTGPAA